jgi:peptidoglycan/xylan/chitin deacetylase (PgdA/CDA1 family)
MTWVLDLFDGKKNPKGNGNKRTYDGQSLKVTFYITSDALADSGDSLLETWQRAVDAGHEIANHTHTHQDIPVVPDVTWADEISQCNSVLTENLGLEEDAILGIRAPFLSFDAALFETIGQTQDMIYDCSVPHIVDPWEDFRNIWPYTLHDDFHDRTALTTMGKHPGIWTVPPYNLPLSPDRELNDHMVGFDSTAYATVHLSANDFYNAMKWGLDRRLDEVDNRAPLTIGVHSDVYSADNPDGAIYDPYASLEQRRGAIEDFIDYALAKPDVRFVTAKQILQWMSDPVPL